MRKRQAFTLIELLVVIGVVAMLMAILLFVGKAKVRQNKSIFLKKVLPIYASIGKISV